MTGGGPKGKGGVGSSAGRRNLKTKKRNLVPANDQPRKRRSNAALLPIGGGRGNCPSNGTGRTGVVSNPASATLLLPDDIVNEILLRLPSGPSIARSRCVCKSWRRLLSDPVFIHDILVHSNFNSKKEDEFAQILIKGKILDGITVYSLLSYNTLESVSPPSAEEKPDLPFVPNKVRSYSFEEDDDACNFGIELSIVGCCDGIVCIADKLYANASDIILWNPTTSETKILPRSPFTGYRDGGGRLYGELIGFGLDPETNDYKVIRSISAPGPADDFGSPHYKGWDVVEIYSSRQDSWRQITQDSASISNPVRYPHTYRGEMLFWWGLNEDEEDLYLESFDMRKEVFGYANFRNPTGKDDWVGHSFTLLKGSIVGVFSDCRVEGNPCADVLSFEIWVLLKFDATVPWTKLFTFPSFDYACNFPAIWKDGCYFEDSRGSLCIYDPKTKETIDYGIEEDRDEEDDMDEVEVVTYVPSEISLSGLKLDR